MYDQWVVVTCEPGGTFGPPQYHCYGPFPTKDAAVEFMRSDNAWVTDVDTVVLPLVKV